MRVRCLGVLLLVHTALANVASTKNDTTGVGVTNTTKNEVLNVTKTIPPNDVVKVVKLKTGRRRNRKSRSTSSSSGEKDARDSRESADRSSLDIQSSGDSSKTDSEERRRNDTLYGTGWRRWHRRCPPCPEDMGKRWRDPTIGWICGGFQRARRTFKSECMMHFRNCQDGTMFVKIHSQKCSDTQPGNFNRGRHWFYDYKVVLTDDSTDTDTESDSSEDKSTDNSDTMDSLSLGK